MNRSTGPSLPEQFEALRDEDPRRYGLLERHLEDLRQTLEQSTRNYASAKQLYAMWDDPPFPPQILGQLLSTIADLGILRVHAHRSNRNRYDLTAYDQARMDQLAVIVSDETESATG
ncbi:hypothetical protein [Halalkalicoccus subterraneus]|uniref:hypothetical protein n=1 Tax=Halalkalicoccus subterraneus TaxID=2675002 RepID=UPI001FE47FF1|nr:hypothetical protein [Halalkalicoccus subterraneus]